MTGTAVTLWYDVCGGSPFVSETPTLFALVVSPIACTDFHNSGALNSAPAFMSMAVFFPALIS
jgi:hypothetical protein